MAQVEGSGTAVIDPKSPSFSPLMPSVKKRVFGFPSLMLPPKTMDQRPPGVLLPTLTSNEPTSWSVTGLNALITSATPETKLKLPTRRSPPNLPKLDGAMATPHGEARALFMIVFSRPPLSLNSTTAPWPAVAIVCAGWPDGAYVTNTLPPRSVTLKGTSPFALTAVGVANAPRGSVTCWNALLNTSMPPAPAVLAANSSVSALLMASPVKLAPATDVWVKAWVVGVPFQAEIEPFRLAKMNAAEAPFPPLAFETSKPIPIALATCPVGPEAPAGGTLTVNKGALPTPVLPVTAKSGVVCVPCCEIQIGLPFANETPQGFFSMGSVVVARPGMSEIRSACLNW